MYKRTLSKKLQSISDHFPVILITGPRQVGKTTLLKMSDSNRNYVTLDDLDLRNLAKKDPALFIKKYKPPLIIDEIQYAPELLSYIKIQVDKDQIAGAYWLTGSQKFHLMKGITESLAGRVAILDLLGFSKAEIDGRDTQPFLPTQEWVSGVMQPPSASNDLWQIYENIWRGSFPKVIGLEPDNRDIFYRSYIQTYIQRDIKDVLSVTDDMAFLKFLTGVAARTGQMMNYLDLARDVGVDQKTIKSWVSVLETSGVVYVLYPYFTNVSKRLVKTPKIYFLDTGLCAYLTKWLSPESLEAGAFSGAILETYMFAEILKSYWHNGKAANFYYYRDMDQKEVDLLIEEGDTLYPVEFKKSATPSMSSVKNFKVLRKLPKNIGEGAVICLTNKETPLTDGITSLPLSYL